MAQQQRFWADPTVEPKRQFRFIMYINNIPSWIVRKVTKPQITIDSTEHKYLNHTFKYPAFANWSDVTVTLVDPVIPDASKTMMDIINRSGYHFPEDPNDVTTLAKASAINALGTVRMVQVGPNEEEVESWELVNAWVTDIKFGDLDYTSAEMTEIQVTMKYDYAIMTSIGRSGLE